MDPITLIGAMSVLAAGICISLGGIGPALGEGNAAANALRAMAMIETTAIYAFVITVLILYFNPFWNYAVEMASK